VPRALKTCSTSGCPELVAQGRCAECRAKAERLRGDATQRGYGHAHRTRFRAGVLRRDPLCVCDDRSHGHGAPCLAPSRHADHHPVDRRELVARGLDPNDPAHGRGLCASCHSKHTWVAQPGGYAAR
jgi:5-methylcytosine-specific restriction protein A